MHELILANFAMHVRLDAAEKECVLSQLQYKIVRKGAALLRSGSVCHHFYFVNKGCLRLFYKDPDNGTHNILFCPENWWAADIVSFSEQTAAFYALDALEDSEVFYFSHEDLEALYIKIPKLERFFRILIQNGFNLYQHRITSVLSQPAEVRYEQFRRQYPGLEQRIAQKEIAAYLGITPVFLSRIRKKKFRK